MVGGVGLRRVWVDDPICWHPECLVLDFDRVFLIVCVPDSLDVPILVTCP